MTAKTAYVHFATGTPVPPSRRDAIESVTVERYMEMRSRSTKPKQRGSVNGKLK